MLSITIARSDKDIEAAAGLFREYEAWLDLDLCFQGFEAELATLPGKYSPPNGRLFLARCDNDIAGCVALRKLSDGIAEMKRLFVRDSFRGQRVGAGLIEALLDSAREIGYQKLRLDTHPPKMKKAVNLYRSYGFIEIPPYYDNPHEDVLFMELDLDDAERTSKVPATR